MGFSTFYIENYTFFHATYQQQACKSRLIANMFLIIGVLNVRVHVVMWILPPTHSSVWRCPHFRAMIDAAENRRAAVLGN